MSEYRPEYDNARALVASALSKLLSFFWGLGWLFTMGILIGSDMEYWQIFLSVIGALFCWPFILGLVFLYLFGS